MAVKASRNPANSLAAGHHTITVTNPGSTAPPWVRRRPIPHGSVERTSNPSMSTRGRPGVPLATIVNVCA